jgi:hypothetical protein
MLKPLRTIALIAFGLVVMRGAVWRAQAQDVKTPYPNMAPVGQYLMERNTERRTGIYLTACRGHGSRKPWL